MSERDPEDWGDALAFLGMLIFVALVVVLLTPGADAQPLDPPFVVMLPDGTEVAACSARYEPEARTFVFGPCVTVFRDGFEAR